MKKLIQILILRIEKWFKTKVIAFVYRDLPFFLYYCELNSDGNYDYSPFYGEKKKMAEFDVPSANRHYIIFQ